MSARAGKRRGRPPKTAVSDRGSSSSSSRFQFQLMKKPKYLQNSDSQFSTPSASRASSPQNSDDGVVSRRTSGRASARRPRPTTKASSNSKRGGHSAPVSHGRRAYESEYHYGSDFGDSSDDQEQEEDPFMASASDSESVDPVEDDNDSDFSMNSYSTNNLANRQSLMARQPTPDPVWLQDIEVPPLELPRSADDLMAPQHLILRITSLYEVLRRFRNIVRLSPFRLEDFCAALMCEEQSNLLSEVHMMLLKAVIREEDTQATHFGPLDQKDSVNISLYLMDSFTWPEIMRCYVESDPQFDADVLAVLSETEYPFCPIEDRMRVLQFLIDQLLVTTPVRDMLLQEGPIHYDDHCRICHRLGDLLCCETCPAVYHLECVDPPLTDVPTEDWQCNMCKDHKVTGVIDCISQHEKHAMLCRQDHLGYDRHGRKYWFICRRLFVETQDGAQVWYYSTVAQFEALFSRLDEDSLELGLCAEIEEHRLEIVRQMEMTETLTNQNKGNKKSYLEILNERVKANTDTGDEGIEEDSGLSADDGRGDESGRMTRNRLQQISTGTLYFKLGMENTFKTYENHFATNVNALNKPQRNEERDKKRHLSHKFSLTEASEFKWNGGSSTSIANMVLALRGTMMQLESTTPAPYMHPNWAGLKKVWTQVAATSQSAKELARVLIVLQTCMKPSMFANVWFEQLGHTRLYRITSNEREEKKKQEKREKRDYTDEEERHRWAYNFVKYTLGMRHQCWKQKGEEYRLHGQWSWVWLSANRREAAKRGKKAPQPQFYIQPHRIMTKVRVPGEEGAPEKIQVIGVSPVTHQRLIECTDVAEEFDEECGITGVVIDEQEDQMAEEKSFDYIDVCAALTTSSRSLYPKIARKSRLDVLLARRTALLQAEEKQMTTPAAGTTAAALPGVPVDIEEAMPKHTIANLPPIPCTEIDMLRIVGEKVRAGGASKQSAASKASASADALNSIMKEVIPIRTHFSQLNKLGKNMKCYSHDCNPGPQLVLTKVSNCYSPLCMQKDRARVELLAIVRRGHTLGISSKDMLNNRALSTFEQQQQNQSTEADEAGILDWPETGEKAIEEEKLVTDAEDLKSMVEDVKRALVAAVEYDEQEYNECLTKKAFEFEMEEKAIVDEKNKLEADARAAEAEKTTTAAPVAADAVKMEVDGEAEVKEDTQMDSQEMNDSAVDMDKSLALDDADSTPKRTLRGRPPKPRNARLREEKAAAAATAAQAENGADASTILKNGLTEEKTHKWSVLKPKKRFTNKGPKFPKAQQVKLEPELGPNGTKRVYSVKCTQGRVSLRKQLKAKPPTTGTPLLRGTKGRITNKVPIVGNFMAKTGRRSILVLPKHELLHVARCGGRVVPLGYNPNAKTNIAVWPYPSPRPLFKTSWLYRMFQANSLNALCLGLRVMWTCMRWDDMQTKPPTLDGKHQVMTENEIVNTELLKHRYMGRHMEYTQYLRRRVIIPLELPKAVREVTSIRLGLRKRKRADSPQHTEPQVTEEWIGEEKLELWEIRQYGERQDRHQVLPVTRQSTGKLPPARQYDVINNSTAGRTGVLTGKTSEEIKEKLEQQLRQQRAALVQKRALESRALPSPTEVDSGQGLPGTSTPKQVIKTRQIQVRQPDGSIRIIQQQIVSAPAPVAKPSEQKVQIMRTADGKLSVKGLMPGQQLIQMPDGKIHIVNAQNSAGGKTVVARTPGTPGQVQQQLIIRPSPATPGQSSIAAGSKALVQKIIAPNIIQKTAQGKVIASKVGEGTPTTPAGQPRVVTTSLQQLLAQNPGQKIVVNQGTPNQRILIASPNPATQAAQPQQQIIVQQPGGQMMVLNQGQRIVTASGSAAVGTPVKTIIQQPAQQSVQYQISQQSPVQQTTAPQSNTSIAQQLASGKLRMINYNGQQVIVKPLNNNSAMIIAHVKQQENGPAQIVVTPQGAAATAGDGNEAGNAAEQEEGSAADGDEEEEDAGGNGEAEAGTSTGGAGQPVVKTITAQILQTTNGPRIVLQGLGQDELTQQQLTEVQAQVKAQLMKAQDANKGATGPTKLQIMLYPQQPPPLTPVQGGSSKAAAAAGYQTGSDGDGAGENEAAEGEGVATSGGGGASINPATKKSIVQKVLARAAAGASKSTLLLSPVKPGQIIKFEGQSIVGKSNNNAIGQHAAAAATSTGAAAGDQDEDDNSFKITPDYIQETIKTALRNQNLNPDIEEKLLNLQRYQEQQLKDGADAPFTYTPISTVNREATTSHRKRTARKHHQDDDEDDLDDELDDGAIPEDDDEDWFAHKRRRKPYVPKTDRSRPIPQRNSSPFIRPKHDEHQVQGTPPPPRLVQHNPSRYTATSTPVAIKPHPQLVTLKPKQPIAAAPLPPQKVMKVVNQNKNTEDTKMDLSEMLANESEKLRDSMLRKREALEQDLKQKISEELDSTLEEIKGAAAQQKSAGNTPTIGNQENETMGEAHSRYNSRKRSSVSGGGAASSNMEDSLDTPQRSARIHNTSRGSKSSPMAPAAATSSSGTKGKVQRSQGGQRDSHSHPSSSKKKEKLYCICLTPYDAAKFYVGCDMCSNWFHGKCVGISEAACEKMDEFICEGCKVAKEGQELYCLCRKPYDESQFYICCDKCQDWFHGRCVGVLQTEADNIDEYICPNCTKNDSVSAVNVKPLTPAEFEHLKRLMKQITTHKSAWPFLEAVDPQEAPDYYKVVTEPMDLSKVESRIDQKWYKTLSDFIGDMTKIFDNCRYYNPKESQFYKLAEALEAFFLQKIKQFRESVGGGM